MDVNGQGVTLAWKLGVGSLWIARMTLSSAKNARRATGWWLRSAVYIKYGRGERLLL